ncbi:MAG: flavodoxin [Ruminococcus sp.]|nr:flavodoxin [Ruminococcus sp.]
MKTAIVYYSMHGNSEFVAKKLADKLDADIIEITPVKAFPDKGFKKFLWGGKSAVMSEKPKLNPYEFSADNYEQVIIGFPVWASRIAPPIRTFVEDNKTALKDKDISAYACQAGSGAEKALNGLKDLLCISDFKSTMILNDPKDKPKDDNENKIDDFCAGLR